MLAAGDIVNGEYSVVGRLGEGRWGVTYEAVSACGERVALKCLSLRTMREWKALDMFEREARVLRSLHHPAIPAYLASFHTDTERDRSFFLVQRLAMGSTLQQLVESGWRGTEDEVVDIAVQVLDVLAYLETLSPPVVHRDINPRNILLDPTTGRVSLVDFGGSQESSLVGSMGSTVVGTVSGGLIRGWAWLGTKSGM